MVRKTPRLALGVAFVSCTVSLIAVGYLYPDAENIAFVVAVAVVFGVAGLVAASAFNASHHTEDELEIVLLRRLANTDSLTKLSNRRAFQEELVRETSRANRYGQPLSLAILDLDNFKAINDSRGHAGGDIALTKIATAISFGIRGEDRAFRVGGDEFAILMANTPPEGALAAIGRLKPVIQQGFDSVTLSIGVASAAGPTVDAELLTQRADSALYEAKARGKDSIVSFEVEPGLAAGTLSRWTEIQDLVAASGPQIALQPIYALSSRNLIAYESLMRMPARSEISGPVEAFDIAERLGILPQLDHLCITNAILAAAPVVSREVSLFINIDPRTLVHPSFSPQQFLATAKQNGLQPGMIVFEIGERSTVPIERLMEGTDALRACGFKLALDDVGSGNAGLQMLRRIHFDFIKIDRSVVLDAVNNGPGKAVMLALVAFAAESGASVIAEGIESAAMLSAVEIRPDEVPDLSIAAVQGFLFGHPATLSVQGTSDSEARPDVVA